MGGEEKEKKGEKEKREMSKENWTEYEKKSALEIAIQRSNHIFSISCLTQTLTTRSQLQKEL